MNLFLLRERWGAEGWGACLNCSWCKRLRSERWQCARAAASSLSAGPTAACAAQRPTLVLRPPPVTSAPAFHNLLTIYTRHAYANITHKERPSQTKSRALEIDSWRPIVSVDLGRPVRTERDIFMAGVRCRLTKLRAFRSRCYLHELL
ncbi:jg19279 [Pararge aegeria aegeria]|uniref:Jg19279 protein n=1 Tax=Pararge aegeria aegeria TaxID=348720 RepID=A0A8S4RNS4_9NEOP|nr:jg19279 [Pararge aegeria aegeria]